MWSDKHRIGLCVSFGEGNSSWRLADEAERRRYVFDHQKSMEISDRSMLSPLV